MTLNEAIASGKKFRRGNTGSYKSADAFLSSGIFSLEDYNATDYVLESVGVISKEVLAAAWDAAASGRSTIAPSHRSEFFKDVTAHLESLGVSVA